MSAAGEAAAQRRGLSLRARIHSDKLTIFVLGSPLPAALAQNFVPCVSPAHADIVVVPRVTDLDTEELNEAGLRVWLAVVAMGKAVIAKADLRPDSTADSPSCLRHLKATMRHKCCLAIAAEFAAACPRLVSALQSYATAPKSKWRVSVGEASGDPSETVLKALPDASSFLRRARRLAPARGDHGTYCLRNIL